MSVRVELHAIRPRKSKFWSTADFDKAIKVALDATAEAVIIDFKKTTKHFKRIKPVFKILRARSVYGRRDAVVEVATDNEIYILISYGSRAHKIAAKWAYFLAFPSIFHPKTRVRFIGSVNKPSGPVDTFRRAVNHPGIEPRLFHEEIARRHNDVIHTLQYYLDYEFSKLAGKP